VIDIELNGKSVSAREGETILETLRRHGVHVPTLCHVPELTPTGACRLCVVDVEGMPNLVPSCAYPVQAGMRIQTHSPRAVAARTKVVQLLLASHPDDCLYCPRNGTCELQALAAELGIQRRLFAGDRPRRPTDVSNAALVRDPNKCILCGKCVRVCEEVQGVAAIDFAGRGSKTKIATAFDKGLSLSSCVHCGQCVVECPTGALSEKDAVQAVESALADPNLFVVVQHAPAVSVTLAEEFGARPGRDVDGELVAALRRLGFKRVFDTSFSADLTIMEEASELVWRLKNAKPLPMLTSCSPGWIKFVEEFYPEFIPNLSTCKSPQQMMGSLVKRWFAERQGLDPSRVVTVSIMPCTAKKYEASRPELGESGSSDVDYVLTTRELARLLRRRGIDLLALSPEDPDDPFGERTTAGKIFGASGGVMEAAVRTAYNLVSGKDLAQLDFKELRGFRDCKTVQLDVEGIKLGAAVVSGLGAARRLLEELRGGRDDLHFIEVMTCPGGCINGGGQPLSGRRDAVRARARALYAIDREGTLRLSHANSAVQRLYADFLGAPLSERSHALLHTHYHARSQLH